MTRDMALARYGPIRAAVQRVLRAAISVCPLSDLMRAAKQLALWRDRRVSLPEDDMTAEILIDIALFEPNQRGRRAFDVFLTAKASQLAGADLELAKRKGKAFFSLFRCAARPGIVGVRFADFLDGNRSL